MRKTSSWTEIIQWSTDIRVYVVLETFIFGSVGDRSALAEHLLTLPTYGGSGLSGEQSLPLLWANSPILGNWCDAANSEVWDGKDKFLKEPWASNGVTIGFKRCVIGWILWWAGLRNFTDVSLISQRAYSLLKLTLWSKWLAQVVTGSLSRFKLKPMRLHLHDFISLSLRLAEHSRS